MESEKVIETKTCTHCWISFDITDRDLKFYDNISPVFVGVKYNIPSPTLCPDCRQQRRLSFRNERKLYKRKCDLTGKDIISIFSPDKPYKVYEQSEWWSDKWDPMGYTRDFDFSRSFFEQFGELMREVPTQSLLNINNENSLYCHNTKWLKECYLCFWVAESENAFYATICKNLMNCTDSSFSVYSSNSYFITDCVNVHSCFSVNKCENSSGMKYCYDCKWCSDCVFSYGLRNKQYHILNEQYTKEKYNQKVEEIFSDKKNLQEIIALYEKSILDFPKISAYFIGCENCTGNILMNCKDSNNCYDSVWLENCKNIDNSWGWKNSIDVYGLVIWSELIFDSLNTGWYFCLFSLEVNDSNHILYSRNCHWSSYLFWCVGLRNKQYCILNKQYAKEEYEELVPKIIEQMRSIWEWGEFFPSSLSPFGYNETVAQEYFPLDKDGAIQKWFNWSDYEAPFPKVEKIIPAAKLPEDIAKIPDDILNWAIECEVTGKPFRIIRQELEFYRKHNLLIPRRHPDQRHLDRMSLRNPRKLFERKCDKCGVEMMTTYAPCEMKWSMEVLLGCAPERPEIVYCESCYNKEIL